MFGYLHLLLYFVLSLALPASSLSYFFVHLQISPNVTLCGSISEDALSGQWDLSCRSSDGVASNENSSPAVGRYLFVYQAQSNLPLAVCEVAVMGWPRKLTTEDAAAAAVVNTVAPSLVMMPAVAVANDTSAIYLPANNNNGGDNNSTDEDDLAKTEVVRYEAFVQGSARRSKAGYYVSGTQQEGISFDDAAELCERRNLKLAKVKTEQEQAAVAVALARRRALDIAADGEQDAGSEFGWAWLGALRDAHRKYWHWHGDHLSPMAFEQSLPRFYSNWVDGFEYSDGDESGDYAWHGTDVVAYLCFQSFSQKWHACNALNDGVHAYVCEERTRIAVVGGGGGGGDGGSKTDSEKAEEAAAVSLAAEPLVTYARTLSTSPLIESVSPSSGLPGTKLTITGTGFMAGFDGSAAVDDGDGVGQLVVSLGATKCEVVASNWTDSVLVVVMPATDAGVLPLRVSSESVGDFGPALPFFVTVELAVFSVEPSAGSMGGGQVLVVVTALVDIVWGRAGVVVGDFGVLGIAVTMLWALPDMSTQILALVLTTLHTINNSPLFLLCLQCVFAAGHHHRPESPHPSNQVQRDFHSGKKQEW
jgi:hypothetical protein